MGHATEVRGGNEQVYGNWDATKGEESIIKKGEKKTPGKGKRRTKKGEIYFLIRRQRQAGWRVLRPVTGIP